MSQREIKFRAWDKKNKEWVKHFEISKDGLVVVYELNANIIKSRSRNDFTLMQYTGLKDKNGKEIYEGDIVECLFYNNLNIPIEKVLSVIFKNGSFGVFDGKDFKVFGSDSTKSIEVIGNVYENPELIK